MNAGIYDGSGVCLLPVGPPLETHTKLQLVCLADITAYYVIWYITNIFIPTKLFLLHFSEPLSVFFRLATSGNIYLCLPSLPTYGSQSTFAVSIVGVILTETFIHTPNNKVHGANMGPTCVLSSPGGPHVGPMNRAVWDRASAILANSALYVWYIRLVCYIFKDVYWTGNYMNNFIWQSSHCTGNVFARKTR